MRRRRAAGADRAAPNVEACPAPLSGTPLPGGGPPIPRCRTSPPSSASPWTRSRSRPARRSTRAPASWSARPTGAGKTVVGEFAVHKALAEGRKAFYTTPIKALSNQKYADLVERYGPKQVGLLTGDNADQRRRARGRDDHRGAAQHALRRVPGDRRPRLRGHGRGALPRRPVPRRGLGGGDHPPPAVGHPGLAVGDGQQRRGVRRLAGHRARPHEGRGQRGAAGPAVAAHAGRQPRVRPVLAAARRPRRRARATPRASSPPASAARPSSTPSWSATSASTSGGSTPGTAAGPALARGDTCHRPRYRPPARSDVVERLDRAGLLPAITFVFSRNGCDAAVHQCLLARAAAHRRGRAGARSPRSSTGAPARCRRRTCTSSASGSGGRACSPASPRTTPGWCRRSRRPSRSASSAAWSRPCSPPRPSRWASTCRRAASSSSGW